MRKRKPLSEMTEDEKNGFWPTVKEAIPPLLPHLVEDYEYEWVRYVEPCAGAGDLIKLLEQHGHECVFASDIAPKAPITPKGLKIQKHDAIQLFNDIEDWKSFASFMGADFIITNPPFSRHHTPHLCDMIRRFSATLPTWLLLPSGFKYNDYAAEFMPYCEKVVAIGRLKWVEGTEHKSSKDFDWYLFDQDFKGQTQFFYKKGGIS